MGISISLEGSEGAGKSFLSELLVTHLKETTELPVLFTYEPGSTPIGEQIRGFLKMEEFKNMHPMTSVFCFGAQRAELYYTIEKPFLENNPNGILIKDRSWLSTIALQRAEGADLEFIKFMQTPFNDIPQKFVIIDIPVEETVVRMEAEYLTRSRREKDWRDKRSQDIFAKIRENYLEFAVKNRDRCILLDCFDDPWIKSGQIKFEITKELLRREGRVIGLQEGAELLEHFTQEAKNIIDVDTEKPILNRFDISRRRKQAENARLKLGMPSREELKAKMHEEWRSLGLERYSTGVERK